MNWDSIEEIKSLDKGNYLGSVKEFLSQVQQAWQETKQVVVPAEYSQVNNLVINGMGGSALGARVVKALLTDKLKIPFEIINSYSVPAFVDSRTLFIFSSYSGTTEEVLATVDEVCERHAKCLGITMGGQLGELLTAKNIPFYQIKPDYNPSGQPRAGVGYAIAGILGLLNQAKLLSLDENELIKALSALEEISRQWQPEVPENQNLAKQLARKLNEKIAVLVGAEFLEGSLHVFRNQLNETAKNFADYFVLSELNHHLMEGLAFPKSNPQNLVFLFLESALFHSRIQKRVAITREVVEKNQIPTVTYSCVGENRLTQALEVIVLGSWVSFYLAILHHIDPSFIPWVDYFKNKLKD